MEYQWLDYRRPGAGYGADVWPAIGGFTFLHSGRPLPVVGEKASRKETVRIILDKKAIMAWRKTGEVWKAVSSRIVMVMLKWVCRKH